MVTASKGGITRVFSCAKWQAMGPTFYGWTLITEDCSGTGGASPDYPYASESEAGSILSGTDSDGDKNYVHVQGIPASTWTIAHGLAKYPAVSVVDSSGRECIGLVDYIDINNIIITFIGGFSGKAFLN